MTLLFKREFSSSSFILNKWQQPVGYPTGINIYNSVIKDKVPLILRDKYLATWYSCGPTVYSSAHAGHASCYVKLDIIQRLLRSYFSINLISAMGITDIDDKIFKRANDLGTTASEISEKYEEEFWKDLDNLGVARPDIILRVTNNINVIKEFINKLFEKNMCYSTSDGTVYFNSAGYEGYGKFRQDLSESESQISDKEKKLPTDFALWKGRKSNELFWEAKWGDGRPGWHIECSAMVSKAFGGTVDFHAGGIDLQFPHHENEEAQSCAYHNCTQWVNYWIHVAHMQYGGDEKMSKSLQNTVLIEDMIQSYSAEVFRMACVLSHYRSPMEYDENCFKSAKGVLNKLLHFKETLIRNINVTFDKSYDDDTYLLEELKSTKSMIDYHLKDDFNTSKTISECLHLNNVVNKYIVSKKGGINPVVLSRILSFYMTILNSMGLLQQNNLQNEQNRKYFSIVEVLVNFRNEVRLDSIQNENHKLLHRCDIIRKKLKDKNIQISDDTVKRVSSWIFRT